MEILEYTLEQIQDPFGILSGNRYEFLFDVEFPEDDELHNDNGVKIKVLFIEDDGNHYISHYHIIENNSGSILDLQLEDDEVETIRNLCQKEIKEY